MQYGKIWAQISQSPQKAKLSRDISNNLQITFNSIIEFIQILVNSEREKDKLIKLALESCLDLFGDFRTSKNMDMVQQCAHILIAVCNTNQPQIDKVVDRILDENESSRISQLKAMLKSSPQLRKIIPS